MAYFHDVAAAVDAVLSGLDALPRRSSEAACIVVRPGGPIGRAPAHRPWDVDPEVELRWMSAMDDLLGMDCLGNPTGDSLDRLSDSEFQRLAAMAECVACRANDR